MQVVSIIGQKGGVGKTTIAVHLACIMHAQGKNVILIDLDPQSSAALWSDRRGAAPFVADAKPGRLHRELEQCERAGIDVVIIDTAPHSSDIAIRALEVADLVLIPCTPSLLDVHGTAASLHAAQMSNKAAACHVVLNGVSSVGTEADDVQGIFAEEGISCAPVRLGYRKAWKRAIAEGLDVTAFEPGSKAAEEARALTAWVSTQIGEGK